jgi:hypothetical protein
MKHFHLSELVLLGLTVALTAPVTRADPVYRRTEVTFHQPVEIPGQVLMPGTYVMKLLDPYMERNVVRFYNAQENHMYAMVFAVPDYRLTPTDHTVITFEERAHNSPQAIKEWFPAGENWGEEFVYGKAKPLASSISSTAEPLQPRAAAVAPVPVAEAKPTEAPAPAAPAQPAQPPVEIAQAAPHAAAASPATSSSASSSKELPKTASDLPLAAMMGGALTLAGAVLRRRTS